ncbi:MAG: hypothetical protein K9N07_03280 [Candidatus Cloacimonetes bacterium]|nr:hypothetical protein [Candidatus Cloacimonadota bacterium]
MKKLFTLMVLLTISITLFGNFDFFPGNPANNANRNYSKIYIPFSAYNININNSILRLEDLMMFEKGHELTDNEKEILTSNDLILDFNTNLYILNFGHQNWNFEFSVKTYGDVEILDQMYSNLVIYGNDTDRPYISHTGIRSKVFSFWRGTLNYAYPKGVYLGMIPGLFPEEKASSFVEYLRDMTLFIGVNINLDYSMNYAVIDESLQEFGSMVDSLHYYYKAQFKYTDEHSVGRLSPSFGLGLKAKIFNGNFHAQIDDVFMQLNYRNLAGGWHERYYRNDLLFFDEDYEAIDETFAEDDSTRVQSRSVKFNPSLSLGFDYAITNDFEVMAKYINNNHSHKNGPSIGAGYQWRWLPIQAVIGYDKNVFYDFRTGLIFNNFELQTGITFYHGFFRYGKGFGLNSAMSIKF